MTRTISVITATVGAALLLAVPAWGDNWGSDRQQTQAPELADLLAAKNGVVDWSDRQQTQAPELADLLAAKNGVVDSSIVDALPAPAGPVVSERTPGRDIEWPQIGVGFGIGILLLLGLGLAMRAVHVRPFAH